MRDFCSRTLETDAKCGVSTKSIVLISTIYVELSLHCDAFVLTVLLCKGCKCHFESFGAFCWLWISFCFFVLYFTSLSVDCNRFMIYEM